jgi:hypothetical protein
MPGPSLTGSRSRPVDDGRYGIDATFQGVSGYERAEHHQADLTRRGVPHSFRQELDGGWTLRLGRCARSTWPGRCRRSSADPRVIIGRVVDPDLMPGPETAATGP